MQNNNSVTFFVISAACLCGLMAQLSRRTLKQWTDLLAQLMMKVKTQIRTQEHTEREHRVACIISSALQTFFKDTAVAYSLNHMFMLRGTECVLTASKVHMGEGCLQGYFARKPQYLVWFRHQSYLVTFGGDRKAESVFARQPWKQTSPMCISS